MNNLRRWPSAFRRYSAFYAKNLWHKAARDQLFFLSSGITFNVLVTIVPLLLITISVLGILVESSTSACEQILSFIQRVMPLASAQAEAPAVRPGGRPGLAGRGRPQGLDLGVDTPFRLASNRPRDHLRDPA